MSYLAHHPWDKFGRPAPVGKPYRPRPSGRSRRYGPSRVEVQTSWTKAVAVKKALCGTTASKDEGHTPASYLVPHPWDAFGPPPPVGQSYVVEARRNPKTWKPS